MNCVRSQLFNLCLLGFVTFGESVRLVVKSDGQTILGSQISFYAWLENPDRSSYDVEWIENSPSESHRRFMVGTMDSDNKYYSNFTLTYHDDEGYTPGRYTVTVTVSYTIIFFFTVDTKVLNYNITPTFHGNLLVSQPGVPKQSETYLSTKTPAEFFVVVNDVSKYLDTAISVNYTWIRNNTIFANSTTIFANTTIPKLNATVSEEGLWTIRVNLTAAFNTTNKNGTQEILMKNGTFDLNVTAKVPIQNFGYTGATWFRHGKLLDLKVSCDGSPPYTYCWHIYYGPRNRTGNETCISTSTTNDCEFPIKRYFYETGLYTLVIIMNNDVSSLVNQSSINVYKATHKPQLSIIVVPITCTLAAIVLVIFGIAYYWENHVRYTVEVADFDFEDSSGVTQVTIVDRIRDTIYTWTSRRGDSTLTLLNSPDEEVLHIGS